MRKYLAILCLTAPLLAREYGFLEYYFVNRENPWHITGRYRHVGQADFRTHHRGHLNYADAYGALFYSQFFNDENSLTYGVTYDYVKLGWKRNPRFSDENFNYLSGSLGFVSTAVESWRWIVNGGATVDAKSLDYGQTGVAHAMLWGRYQMSQMTGVHIGVIGWYGIRNGYSLPIIGFDSQLSSKWRLNLIFPVNMSLNYAFNNRWSIEAAFSSFGNPYRFPRRARHGINGFHRPIFMVFASGADLSLRYTNDPYVRFDIGGGWNFGGWILVKDHHSKHGKYFHFNGAPYGQATLAFTF